MHLYIRSSSFSTEVSDIHLLDGHIPAIGTLTPNLESPEDVFPSMEPAIWFKVLLIDSVSIDCTKHAIHWNSVCPLGNDIDGGGGAGGGVLGESAREKSKRVSESMFVGGECYGYHNDLDELFHSTQQLLDRYAASSISCTTFHKQLFSLLHCYVLPNIKLNTDDLLKLTEALHIQEEMINDCDGEIMMKYGKLEEVSKAMQRQREATYIPELTQQQKIAQTDAYYPPELVKCLQKDIDLDIREEWAKIETHNDEIQTLKSDSDQDSSSSNSGSDKPNREHCEFELSVQRQAREKLLKNYELMISARESLLAIANGGSLVSHPPPGRLSKKKKKSKFSRKKPPQSNPLHNIYIELHNRFNEMEDQIRHTTLKKVRMISVKEAIKGSLEELKDHEETFGMDLDQAGSRPTDVLRRSKVPVHWQTLTEKVSSCINKGGSITKLFQDFQLQMLNQCQGLIDEHENLLNSVPLQSADKEVEDPLNAVFYDPKVKRNAEQDKPKAVPIVGDIGCFSKRPNTRDMYREALPSLASLAATEAAVSNRNTLDFLFVFDRENDYLKKGIENVKKAILKHFDTMVKKFLGKLKMEDTDANQRKVWLCYESFFYEAVMPYLVRIYDRAYSSTMLNLQDLMPNITIKDLNIEDTFLMSLLEPCGEVDEVAQVCGDQIERSKELESAGGEPKNTNPESDRTTNLESGRHMANPKSLSLPTPVVDKPTQDGASVSCQDVREKSSTEGLPNQPIQNIPDFLSCEDVRKKCISSDTDESNRGVASTDHHPATTSSDYVSCQDVREKHTSSDADCSNRDSDRSDIRRHPKKEKKKHTSVDFIPCENVCEKHKSSDSDSNRDSGVFRTELLRSKTDSVGSKRHGHSYDSQDFDANSKPRLEMLPSMGYLSESSSCSSDSNTDFIDHSDINLKLLQEAEDIVAGLKRLDTNDPPIPELESSNRSQKNLLRAVSYPEGRVSTIQQSQEEAAGDVNVRHITIYKPSSITYVYHRCTWPIPHAAHTYKHIDASVECGEDAFNFKFDDTTGTLSQPPQPPTVATLAQLKLYKYVKFQAEIKKQLQPAFESLTKVLSETAPLSKLQSLTQCLRDLDKQLSVIQQNLSKTIRGASSDDLLDLLVLLLCNYDPVLACRLYTQIMLLSDMMAPFFEGGPYSFSLVQFSCAFTFLQEKMVLKQSIADNARVRRELESVAEV